MSVSYTHLDVYKRQEDNMASIKKYFCLVVTVLLFACKQENKNIIIPVNDFFKSQDKATYRISPDGKSISYLKLQDKKQNLFVEDIATGKAVQLTKVHEKNINFYAWVSNDAVSYTHLDVYKRQH